MPQLDIHTWSVIILYHFGLPLSFIKQFMFSFYNMHIDWVGQQVCLMLDASFKQIISPMNATEVSSHRKQNIKLTYNSQWVEHHIYSPGCLFCWYNVYMVAILDLILAKRAMSYLSNQSINEIQIYRCIYTGAVAHASSRVNRSTEGGAPALCGRIQLTVHYWSSLAYSILCITGLGFKGSMVSLNT